MGARVDLDAVVLERHQWGPTLRAVVPRHGEYALAFLLGGPTLLGCQSLLATFPFQPRKVFCFWLTCFTGMVVPLLRLDESWLHAQGH